MRSEQELKKQLQMIERAAKDAMVADRQAHDEVNIVRLYSDVT